MSPKCAREKFTHRGPSRETDSRLRTSKGKGADLIEKERGRAGVTVQLVLLSLFKGTERVGSNQNESSAAAARAAAEATSVEAPEKEIPKVIGPVSAAL